MSDTEPKAATGKGKTRPGPWPLAGGMVAGVVFLVSLGVYAATLSRSVEWGDSGELTAAAYVLGVPHAPGYPLLMLLGRLASLVPLSSVVVRVNVLNAVFAAAAASLTSAVALRLGCRWLGALIAGLALAFSQVFWSQALAFEVYSLSAMMLAVLLLLALRWADSGRGGALFVLAFVYVLGMSTHLLLVAFAPAFLAFLWAEANKRRMKMLSGEEPLADSGRGVRSSRLAPFLWAAGGVILGAAIYLYLPLRAAAEPPINLGHPDTWRDFVRVVTGGPGRGKFFSGGWDQFTGQLSGLLGWTVSAFYWPGVLLAVLGVVRMAVTRREVLILMGPLVAINLGLAAGIPVIDYSVYLIPTHLVLAIWLGLGADWLVQPVVKGERACIRKVGAALRSPVALWGFGLLLLLLPCSQVWDNWARLDSHREHEAADFAQDFLDSVENDALLVTDWWYVGPLFYERFVQGKRGDVEIVPQLSKVAPVDRLALFTQETVRTRPVYAAEFVTRVIQSLQSPTPHGRGYGDGAGRFLLLPMGRSGGRAYRILDRDAPLPPGREHPPIEVAWEAAPGYWLTGFDIPRRDARQGGVVSLACYWRIAGGAPPPRIVVALDSERDGTRLWRQRSALAPAASGRLRPGEQALVREEFIAWLPSDAPLGNYRLVILATQAANRESRTLAPHDLDISVAPWQDQR